MPALDQVNKKMANEVMEITVEYRTTPDVGKELRQVALLNSGL